MDFNIAIVNSFSLSMLRVEMLAQGRFVVSRGGRILGTSEPVQMGAGWVATMTYSGCSPDALVRFAESRGLHRRVSVRA